MEIRFLRGVFRQLRRPQGHFLSTGSTRICSYMRHASTRHPEQATPLGGYYELLLSQPLQSVASTTRQPTTSSTAPSRLKIEDKGVVAKARVVFGSPLVGPAERRSEIRKKSKLIAGVWVPPKPEEPDNCCMSGCVNCVWDQYRDEMEEWVAARRAADVSLRKEKEPEKGRSRKTKTSTSPFGEDSQKDAQSTALSMDDDGGGMEANWGGDLDTELFKGIPVGILEFMKQEKRLKEKRAREGTVR